MTATQILSELQHRGVSLEVAGDKLRFRPKAAVTPDLVEALRRRKSEILAVLRESPAPVKARVRGQDVVTETAQAEICFHCHGEKICRCISCAVPGSAAPRWEPGQCVACKGSGFLCWPEVIQ